MIQTEIAFPPRAPTASETQAWSRSRSRSSCRRPPRRKSSVRLDVAMTRADDAATRLRLVGVRRKRFLRAVAPEFRRWLKFDGDGTPPDCPTSLLLSKLAHRVEVAIRRLRLSLADVAVVLETLAPEAYVPASDGVGTVEVPGSEAKVQVMIARAERGEALFQRGDVGLPDCLGFLTVVRGREVVRVGVKGIRPDGLGGEAKGGNCEGDGGAGAPQDLG